MVNSKYQTLCIKVYGHITLFVILFFCFIPNVFADSLHYENPITNKAIATYALPEDLNELSLEKLIALKKERESALQSLKPNQKPIAIIEQELFNSLIAYDDIRLQISEVIAELIVEYNLTGDYKKKLLGFSDTFKNKVKHARNSVQTLDEYKTYSTHFAIAYISLIYTFKQNQTFYKRYANDINNSNSTIGKYVNELKKSYKKVEQANKSYEASILAQELENLLVKVNNEIKQRETELLVLNIYK